MRIPERDIANKEIIPLVSLHRGARNLYLYYGGTNNMQPSAWNRVTTRARYAVSENGYGRKLVVLLLLLLPGIQNVKAGTEHRTHEHDVRLEEENCI